MDIFTEIIMGLYKVDKPVELLSSPRCKVCSSIITMKQKFCSECGVNCEESRNERLALENEWYKNRQAAHEAFIKAALYHCEILYHPKGRLAFDMAWKRGEEEGLLKVVEYLEEYATLMLPVRSYKDISEIIKESCKSTMAKKEC